MFLLTDPFLERIGRWGESVCERKRKQRKWEKNITTRNVETAKQSVDQTKTNVSNSIIRAFSVSLPTTSYVLIMYDIFPPRMFTSMCVESAVHSGYFFCYNWTSRESAFSLSLYVPVFIFYSLAHSLRSSLAFVVAWLAEKGTEKRCKLIHVQPIKVYPYNRRLNAGK